MSAGMAGIIAAHTPSRWRSFSNGNIVLRCCGQDFGNATKKPKQGDVEKTYADHAAHVADELTKAGFGNVQAALLSATDEMPIETLLGADKASVWLRARAHSMDPAGRALAQAIHDRKADG